MIRLLVLDVDGTLLNPEGAITSRVAAALRAAADRGVTIALATGRRFLLTKPLADQLGVPMPLIVHNGAAIRWSATGECLYAHRIPEVIARAAVRTMIDHGIQPIVFEHPSSGDRVFSGPAATENALTRRYLRPESGVIVRAPLDDLPPPGDPVFVVGIDTEPRAAAAAAALTPLLRDDPSTDWSVMVTPTDRDPAMRFIELTSPETTKGRATLRLAHQLGIARESIMAIGDHYNDLDLLRVAGVSVAMANAAPEALAVATYRTSSNAEDGVAEAVERLILR
ncbi:MAG: Cof-type HAD-IIB family hydrolase [Dehalococcoidia bacterium]|nr:Cof-type HAD-IIB family hydrolase [Dehalococcoidia bacterium]